MEQPASHGSVKKSREGEHTVDGLGSTGEVNGLDTTDLLLTSNKGRSGLLGGSGADGDTSSSDEGAALSGGGGQLAGQWAAESLGETS